MDDTSPPLTRRQLAFARYLREGHTKAAAAHLAGYSTASAANVGSQLSRDTRIVKLLEETEE